MRARSKFRVATAAFCAVMGSYALPAHAMGKWHARWAFSGDHSSHSGGGSGGTSESSGRFWSSGPQGGGGSSGAGSVDGDSNRGAPGPIAGAGLPFLLIAGGYALVRRYCNRSKVEQQYARLIRRTSH